VCERFASIQPKSLLQMDWNGCRQQQKRMSSASSRILTMLSVVLLVLATGLAATATSSEEDDGSSTPPFTDQWAVHISGGDQVADAIAARHGFTNLGKVKKIQFFHPGENAPVFPTDTTYVSSEMFIYYRRFLENIQFS
jgi:hypothetical protein